MFSRGAFFLSLAFVALADPIPTGPSPGQVFTEGSACTINWTPDTTGNWKIMNIELMTGNNFNMVHLTTVATVDGTASPGTFSYPCPPVTLHAPVYFYQFSHSATNLLWTGRFAISNQTGATEPAPNPTQPNGQAIPWGTGALVDSSTAVPPPSYLPGGSTGSNTTNSTSPVTIINPPIPLTPSSVMQPSSTSGPVTTTPLSVLPSRATTGSSSGLPAVASANVNAPTSSGSSSGGALMLGEISTPAAHAGVALAIVAGMVMFMV
ncbi:hypothetical protein F5148DRAFT_1148522 [Russula earlei]|uniref:Uncharacterized protein n=1 Tax=Russula earlei TaxID=71964 RepID=A0ACC0UBZ9_9AGAM|nr:hypothetical protein F5148DRAFT_1148522 [Russula earlei]